MPRSDLRSTPSWLPLVATLAFSAPAFAEDVPPDGAAPIEEDPLAAFPWKTTGSGALGDKANIEIPEGLRFLEGEAAVSLIEAMGNLTSKTELGLIGTPDLEWFVVFYFDDVGYVKDDEKDDLDADEMAESMRDGLESSNEERRDRGLDELHFDGWAMPPRFNDDSKQLEWAHRLRDSDGVSVNYNTRVLGRRGVMRQILVTDPDLLDATLPQYHAMMKGFSFIDGERYAEYREGDKIAEYGLIALVAGGGAAVAAKTGLLAAFLGFFKKGAKLIVVGVVAAFAFLKKLLSRKSED